MDLLMVPNFSAMNAGSSYISAWWPTKVVRKMAKVTRVIMNMTMIQKTLVKEWPKPSTSRYNSLNCRSRRRARNIRSSRMVRMIISSCPKLAAFSVCAFPGPISLSSGPMIHWSMTPVSTMTKSKMFHPPSSSLTKKSPQWTMILMVSSMTNHPRNTLSVQVQNQRSGWSASKAIDTTFSTIALMANALKVVLSSILARHDLGSSASESASVPDPLTASLICSYE
mmetsp:Transcript_49851/g.131767  ORF Transcript_49851/g.131767 Transcript_49851/m.131767 type:complete len:225 (+) Transcript_49851:703-1377(+)